MESLAVNNSSNQAGTVHHTDYEGKSEKLKEILRKAIELQRRVDELSDGVFPDGEFEKEIAVANERLQNIIHEALSPMLGYLFVNEVYQKLEEAV